MQPATAKWYDRRDSVFIEFLVEDSKDLQVKFEKSKLDFRCVGGIENLKHQNELDLFDSIDPNASKHKRTDRSVLCCLKKSKAGRAWSRLTKDKAKMMNTMGGEDGMPDLGMGGMEGLEEHDSDDEKMPDLE
ncbi:unnamed protein product, partial [Coregonus sp. 'balchen']